jgi:hypothetical protein
LLVLKRAADVGGPPGDYRVGSRAITIEIGLAPLPHNVLKVWRGDEGMAFIQFGPDGLPMAAGQATVRAYT